MKYTTQAINELNINDRQKFEFMLYIQVIGRDEDVNIL